MSCEAAQRDATGLEFMQFKHIYGNRSVLKGPIIPYVSIERQGFAFSIIHQDTVLSVQLHNVSLHNVIVT